MKREDFIFDHMDDEYEDYWFKVVGDAGKTELLKHKTRCPHGCLYCYWKDMKG